MRPLLALAGIISLIFAVEHTRERRKGKKIFISFAMKDQGIREMFVGQMKHPDVDYRFQDRSVRKPWDKAWKTNCRKRIQACDAVVILLTKNSNKASGVLWEAKCAMQEKKPICLVYGSQKNRPKKIAPELKSIDIIDWTRQNIAEFIAKLK